MQDSNTGQILAADWVIPMTEDNQWMDNNAVVILNDEIVDLLNTQEAKNKYPDYDVIDLPGHVIMPGFVNSHCHAAMNLLRGFSDDLPLKQWLEDAIWPAEGKFVSNEFVYEGTQLAIAELIRSGTTCFQDMYFMPKHAANAAVEAGIRAVIGFSVMEFPTSWAKDSQEYIDKGMAVFHDYNHPLIDFNFAPHAPYTVAKETFEKLVLLSEEHNMSIQVHVHETDFEVESFEKEHGVRPITRLKEIGLLTPKLNAVHMTQLNDQEIQWFAEAGSHVIHCPQSNMKLASGICPTQKLIEAGVNVAIGTDGAASNNDLDMLDETKSAALVAKLDELNPTAMNAYQALYAATMGGAKALGKGDKIGSIAKGKLADLIAIDLNRIETQPLYNPISQIVYAASRDQITHLWVNGKMLMKNRELLTIDSNKIMQQTLIWRDKIAAIKV